MRRLFDPERGECPNRPIWLVGTYEEELVREDLGRRRLRRSMRQQCAWPEVSSRGRIREERVGFEQRSKKEGKKEDDEPFEVDQELQLEQRQRSKKRRDGQE